MLRIMQTLLTKHVFLKILSEKLNTYVCFIRVLGCLIYTAFIWEVPPPGIKHKTIQMTSRTSSASGSKLGVTSHASPPPTPISKIF